MRHLFLCIVFLLGVNMATGKINPQPPLGGGHPPPPATGSGQFKGGALGAWQANPPLGWIPFGSRVGSNPILTPGNGFVLPPPSFPGKYPKAIARWDVVPYQVIDEPFRIGVVAFHVRGIKEVKFSLEGGPWTSVKSMTLNPRTGVKEYCATIDPALLPDGRFEVQAIAYPNVGIPRVLAGGYSFDPNPQKEADQGIYFEEMNRGTHSLLLHANSGGTLVGPTVYVSPTGDDTQDEELAGAAGINNPVQTIGFALRCLSFKANYGKYGTIILRDAGKYQAGKTKGSANVGCDTSDSYITIMPDPSLGVTNAKDGIVEVDQEGFGTNLPEKTAIQLRHKLHWKNISFDTSKFALLGTGNREVTWLDGCFLWHRDWAAYDPVMSINFLYYVTDCDVENRMFGYLSGALIRNSTTKNCTGDAFKRPNFIINCTIDNMDGDILTFHTDAWQHFMTWDDPPTKPHDNIITYGLTGINLKKTQDLFISTNEKCKNVGTQENPIWRCPPDKSIINIAFVDCTFENNCVEPDNWGGPPFSQFAGRWFHVLIQNCSLPYQRLVLRDDITKNPRDPLFNGHTQSEWWEAEEFLIKDCLLNYNTYKKYITDGDVPPGTKFVNCTPGPTTCP